MSAHRQARTVWPLRPASVRIDPVDYAWWGPGLPVVGLSAFALARLAAS
ncbi:hypothetical protein [Nocardioides sp.]|nr:hypothetical protein [Nocardioides sp.]